MQLRKSKKRCEFFLQKGVLMSVAVSIDKAALMARMGAAYDEEGCGVCEKTGSEVIWFSDYSRCAHKRCYDWIKAADSALMAEVAKLFKGKVADQGSFNQFLNHSHRVAIEAVREKCGAETVLGYLEKNGIAALAKLFIEVGLPAVSR